MNVSSATALVRIKHIIVNMSCPKALPKLLMAIAALVIGGCNAVQGRIDKNPTAFAALSPQNQARVRKHIVDIGDSTDVVYIALGKPDDIFESTTSNIHQTVWAYDNRKPASNGTVTSPSFVNGAVNPGLENTEGNGNPEQTVLRTWITFVLGKAVEIKEMKRR